MTQVESNPVNVETVLQGLEHLCRSRERGVPEATLATHLKQRYPLHWGNREIQEINQLLIQYLEQAQQQNLCHKVSENVWKIGARPAESESEQQQQQQEKAFSSTESEQTPSTKKTTKRTRRVKSTRRKMTFKSTGTNQTRSQQSDISEGSISETMSEKIEGGPFRSTLPQPKKAQRRRRRIQPRRKTGGSLKTTDTKDGEKSDKEGPATEKLSDKEEGGSFRSNLPKTTGRRRRYSQPRRRSKGSQKTTDTKDTTSVSEGSVSETMSEKIEGGPFRSTLPRPEKVQSKERRKRRPQPRRKTGGSFKTTDSKEGKSAKDASASEKLSDKGESGSFRSNLLVPKTKERRRRRSQPRNRSKGSQKTTDTKDTTSAGEKSVSEGSVSETLSDKGEGGPFRSTLRRPQKRRRHAPQLRRRTQGRHKKTDTDESSKSESSVSETLSESEPGGPFRVNPSKQATRRKARSKSESQKSEYTLEELFLRLAALENLGSGPSYKDRMSTSSSEKNQYTINEVIGMLEEMDRSNSRPPDEGRQINRPRSRRPKVSRTRRGGGRGKRSTRRLSYSSQRTSVKRSKRAGSRRAKSTTGRRKITPKRSPRRYMSDSSSEKSESDRSASSLSEPKSEQERSQQPERNSLRSNAYRSKRGGVRSRTLKLRSTSRGKKPQQRSVRKTGYQVRFQDSNQDRRSQDSSESQRNDKSDSERMDN